MLIFVKFSISLVNKVVLPDPDQPATPNKGGACPKFVELK